MTPDRGELARIRALSRRQAYPADLARRMSEHLARPHSSPPFDLYPEQAVTLLEASDCAGVVMPVPVGGGKTIVSFLVPEVCDLRRPLLIIPAHLREKTLREWQEYNQYWRLRPLVVKSYTEISRDKDAEGISRLLETLAPDGIICDEAHHLGNLDAGCTKKIRRYLLANPHVKFFALTGTLLKATLMDGWHLCAHALKDRSPLPLRKQVCAQWSEAVDPQFDDVTRARKAAAAGLDELGHGDPRRVIGEWIAGTPGYVSASTRYDGPLSFASTTIEPPDACREHIGNAHAGKRPDGLPIDPFARLGIKYPGTAEEGQRIAFQKWRLAQTLFLGYWDKPHPEPPEAWVLSKAHWFGYVAGALATSPELDTPEAVVYAVDRGKLGGKSARAKLAAWRKARDSYRYRAVATWVDTAAPALVYAAEWMNEHPHGLVWCASESAGHQICRLAGRDPAEYFFGAGQGESDGAGRVRKPVEAHDGPAVLTIAANRSGRNLQHGWRDNLMLISPSLSGEWEQMIGRTHRPGQKHSVSVEIVVGLQAHQSAWESAWKNALFVEGMTGDSPKILQATGLAPDDGQP